MRYEERASLSRSKYQKFEETYTTPRFLERTLLVLFVFAAIAGILFLIALFSQTISLSDIIPVAVFFLVAFSLGSASER